MRGAQRRDGRKAGVHLGGIQVAEIHHHIGAGIAGAAPYLAGHDIAWAQITQGVHAVHHRAAVHIAQHATGTTHRLAHQRERARTHGECGGVELHHLHIGQCGPGPAGECGTIGRGTQWVGGATEHMTSPTSGEYDHTGKEVLVTGRATECDSANAAIVNQEVKDPGAVGDADAWLGPDRGHQRTGDVAPCRITAGVHHARARVCALAREGQVIAGAIECHAQRGQIGDARRPVGTHRTGHVGVSQACTGLEGVQHMGSHGVVGPDGCSDSTLGPGGAALTDRALGHQHHVTVCGDTQGGEHAREPATDDDGR